MNVIGIRVWYGDGSSRATAIVQPIDVTVVKQAMSAWPKRDLQCIMLYFDQDYAPGKCYREILQGSDTYWYDPLADQTDTMQCWGKSNETPQQVRARLGNQIVTYEGKWMTDAGYAAVCADAMAARERPV